MFYRVRIDPELIEPMFKAGYQVHVRCIEGVPVDARLVGLQLVPDFDRRTYIEALFMNDANGGTLDVSPVYGTIGDVPADSVYVQEKK